MSSVFSRTQSPEAQPGWRRWGIIAVGALAIAVASIFLFSAHVRTSPEIPAEEVVGGLEALIAELDAYDPVRTIYQEADEEARSDWREDLGHWPAGNGRDLQRW